MWKAETLFGRKEGLGHMVTVEPSEVHLKQSVATDRAWSSPTRLADVIARRKAVLTDSHFRSARSKGSNGGEHKASRTIGKSHEGTLAMRGGFSLSTPLR